MALALLTESPADAAEFSAVAGGTVADPAPAPAPEPTPAVPPEPAPQPTPAVVPAAAPAAAAPATPPAAPTPVAATVPPGAEVVPTPVTPEPVEPTKYVRHAALHEAREENKLLKARLAALEAGMPQPAVPAPKSIEEDPIGAIHELRELVQDSRKQNEQRAEMTAFTQRVQAHEADFSKATPDYAQAVAHLREARAGELRTLGVPDHQIGPQLMQEALATAKFALDNGRNPGEVFYALAKTRGYAVPAPVPPTPDPVVPAVPASVAPIPTTPAAAVTPISAAPVPAAAPTPAVEVDKAGEARQALERINRGQRAGRPTAGGGGSAPAGELSLADGANLQGAAFDQWFEANARKLMN